jgi:ubiquinone/menaquinone biosynthesis C-methylase UbiE
MKVRESGMPEEALWRTFFDPPAILGQLMFDPGADVVEFGCGYGTFTVAAAQMTSGIVHALDIEPDMIEATAAKVSAAGLANVRLATRDFVADGTGLPGRSVDYAMQFNILHGTRPVELLREAFRVLRPGGRNAVIHWNPAGTPRGPDPSIRPRPEQCRAWLEESGFEVALPPVPLPPYHFGVVGRRPRDQ